jgi:hypothetical protein
MVDGDGGHRGSRDGIYVQFTAVPDGFAAEAVGESNIRKLTHIT